MKFITTPIFYPNDKPHLGHAYTCVIADFLSRYYRQKGETVRFATGLDEHGQKIAKTAEKLNLSPEDYVEQMSFIFKNMMTKYQIEYDIFTRTTSSKHKKAVTHFWKTIQQYIYKSNYEGWYDCSNECFIKEDEAKELQALGRSVTWLKEECYFFKLSLFTEYLLNYYEHANIFPTSNELKSFVKTGLKDIAISRQTVKWGIEVPYKSFTTLGKCIEYIQTFFEKKHTIYVWLDALVNYLTALDYPFTHEQFWKNSIHILGKDIARFHGVYWPAFLQAAKLPSPKTLLIHGWWLINDDKMSKSYGQTIDPIELLDKYDISQIRWFFLREMAFGQDANFSYEQLDRRCNELTNIIGNLINRCLQLIEKKYNGKTLPVSEILYDTACFDELIEKRQFHMYTSKILEFACACNKYIDNHQPWRDIENSHQILSNTVHAINQLQKLLYPIMPDISQIISNSIQDQITTPSLLWSKR